MATKRKIGKEQAPAPATTEQSSVVEATVKDSLTVLQETPCAPDIPQVTHCLVPLQLLSEPVAPAPTTRVVIDIGRQCNIKCRF